MDENLIISSMQELGQEDLKKELAEKIKDLANNYLKKSVSNYVTALRKNYPNYDDSIIFEACKNSNRCFNFVESDFNCIEKRFVQKDYPAPLQCSDLLLPDFRALKDSYILGEFGGVAPHPSQGLVDAENALKKIMERSEKNKDSRSIFYVNVCGERRNLKEDEFSEVEPYLDTLCFIYKVENYSKISPPPKKARKN